MQNNNNQETNELILPEPYQNNEQPYQNNIPESSQNNISGLYQNIIQETNQNNIPRLYENNIQEINQNNITGPFQNNNLDDVNDKENQEKIAYKELNKKTVVPSIIFCSIMTIIIVEEILLEISALPIIRKAQKYEPGFFLC